MDIAAALSATKMLQGVPSGRLGSLADGARERRLGRGDFVWLQGDPGGTVCFLVSGQLKTSRVGPDGEEIVVQILAEGDHTGLPGAFSVRGTRATQVQAIEDCVVVTIAGDNLLAFLQTSPIVLRRVVEELAANAILAIESWGDSVFLDVVGRVARKLLDLAGRDPGPANGTVVELPYSQRTLAGMISASREHTNRALARLGAAGDVAIDGSKVTILDVERLRRRAEGAGRDGE